jgi:GGDEF domain-containing protein
MLSAAAATAAQPIMIEKAGNVSQASLQLVEVAVLRHVDPALGLTDILQGRGGVFVRQAGLDLEDSQWGLRSLWVRLTFQGYQVQAGQAAPATHVLEFPKSYLDDVRLYSPPLAGSQAWRVQRAGDMVAHSDWFLSGLYPRFLMPAASDVMNSPEGKQVLYVQIKHLLPITVTAKLRSLAQSTAITQASFLGLGLALGAMALTAAVCLLLAALNKDSIFSWYSGYAVAAMVTTASHSGLAHLLVWPVQGFWPSTATLSALLFAAACQIQFCWVLFQPRGRNGFLYQSAITIGLMCAATAFAYAFLPSLWTQLYFLTVCLVSIGFCLSFLLVYLAWTKGNRLALAWLISFAPLLITVVIALLDGAGILRHAMAYNLPQYSAAIYVVLFGLSLQWFARERHGQTERAKALAATDPLTGFATAEAFKQRLQLDWHSRQTQRHGLAVAYVELQNPAEDKKQLDQLLIRSVRVLRSASQAHDMVARLDGSLLALIMHNTQAGDDLSQRLSRIVALGLMENTSDRMTHPLQFRIAATTRQQFQKPLTELDPQLRELLAQSSSWGSRPIRYIDHSQKTRTSPLVIESIALEKAWEAALKQEQSLLHPSTNTTRR